MVVNCTVTHSQYFANMEKKRLLQICEKNRIFLIWEKPTCVKSRKEEKQLVVSRTF